MDNKKKIVISVVSFVAVVAALYFIFFLCSETSFVKSRVDRHTRPEWQQGELYYEENQEMLYYYSTRFVKLIIGFIAVVLTTLITIALNLLMWFNKPLFGIPLTPEQAAERKRVIAERKKAKLQERLNKLN